MSPLADEEDEEAAEEDEADEGVRLFFILSDNLRREIFSPSSVNCGSSTGSKIWTTFIIQ